MKYSVRFGTYRQEMLGKGLKGRIWFWLKKRQMVQDRNFIDLHNLKILMAGNGVGRHWVDGKFIWNVWVSPKLYAKDDGFHRLSRGHFEAFDVHVARLKKKEMEVKAC